MAQESQITGSNMSKFSIAIKKMHGIRWIVENVLEIDYGEKVFSPEFYLAPECKCRLSLQIYSNCLNAYICNKSDTKIEIERTLVLYDCNNRKLHENKDERIFSLEKDKDVEMTRYLSSQLYELLTNGTLIIRLCVTIKEIVTRKINHLKCDIDPERKLREDFKTMLENPVNSDVSLQVGDERIPAHWAVLCSRSPYFKRMFDSGMRESVQNSVTITDSSLGTVKRFIQFLYTADFVEKDDLKELFELYYVADKYEVLDLRHLCAHKIMFKATANNVCQILQLAYRHNDKGLKMEAMDFIQLHSDAVFQTEGWEKFKAIEPLAAEFCSFLCMKKK